MARVGRVVLLVAVAAANGGAAQALESSGAQLFQAHCERCHVSSEMNGRLAANWLGKPAGDLYQRIKKTMPAESPGSRSDAEYLALTAYVLERFEVLLPQPLASVAEFDKVSIQPVVRDNKAAATLPDVDWREFNGNLAAQRYVPLEQIDAGNVGQLQIAWRRQAGMFGPAPEIKNVSSPLVADGMMFATVGVTRDVVALDPATGQLLWMWRADEGERFANAARKGSGRGVAYWQDGVVKRVFNVTPGYTLVSLDARTGLPDPVFGVQGKVDLQQGLRRGQGRQDLDIGLSFPPLVMNDVIVVGAAMRPSFRPPSKANVKGDVRGFDVRTGKLLWTFRTIPLPGEPGAETWRNGSAEFTGNAGVWAPLSGDPELGLVYLPVESATGDRYGGDRPGNNLFANSLVALDVKTGKLRWHYQLIHHDIWDWDNPSAPILGNLPNGRKVVVQVTKQAFAYTFDRATGKPIWPIKETPVPQTDTPGEWTAKTQPFPTKPAPFDVQGLGEKDLIDFTPDVHAAAKAAVKPYRLGKLYAPASLVGAKDGTQGTLTLPSSTGGANWEGGALDPETGILYVPSRTDVELIALVSDPSASSVAYISAPANPPGVLGGLPLVKPPWGRITAIDMNRGDHLWWVPNADTPQYVREHPALSQVDLPPRTGIPTHSGLLLTKTLLFAGEGWRGGPTLRAHDKRSGKILAAIKLPATQAGQPISYQHQGKQYIAMFVADGTAPAELVALSLPDTKRAASARAAKQ